MNKLIYQVPLKNNEFRYHESFCSELFGELRLGKNPLTALIQTLGNDREKIAALLRKFVSGKQKIIFDERISFQGEASFGVSSPPLSYLTIGAVIINCL